MWVGIDLKAGLLSDMFHSLTRQFEVTINLCPASIAAPTFDERQKLKASELLDVSLLQAG